MSDRYTLRHLNDELVKYVEVKELLGAEDLDPETLLDTLEGATNLQEALAEIAKSAREDEAMAAGVTRYIEDLQSRKSRLETSAETKRALIVMAMERAELKTVRAAECTLSLSPTMAKLVVKDEAQIPSRFFRPADPTLDKAAVRAAIESGEPIEGAELSNGGIKLTIRSK